MTKRRLKMMPLGRSSGRLRQLSGSRRQGSVGVFAAWPRIFDATALESRRSRSGFPERRECIAVARISSQEGIDIIIEVVNRRICTSYTGRALIG